MIKLSNEDESVRVRIAFEEVENLEAPEEPYRHVMVHIKEDFKKENGDIIMITYVGVYIWSLKPVPYIEVEAAVECDGLSMVLPTTGKVIKFDDEVIRPVLKGVDNTLSSDEGMIEYSLKEFDVLQNDPILFQQMMEHIRKLRDGDQDLRDRAGPPSSIFR